MKDVTSASSGLKEKTTMTNLAVVTGTHLGQLWESSNTRYSGILQQLPGRFRMIQEIKTTWIGKNLALPQRFGL